MLSVITLELEIALEIFILYDPNNHVKTLPFTYCLFSSITYRVITQHVPLISWCHVHVRMAVFYSIFLGLRMTYLFFPVSTLTILNILDLWSVIPWYRSVIAVLIVLFLCSLVVFIFKGLRTVFWGFPTAKTYYATLSSLNWALLFLESHNVQEVVLVLNIYESLLDS